MDPKEMETDSIIYLFWLVCEPKAFSNFLKVFNIVTSVQYRLKQVNDLEGYKNAKKKEEYISNMQNSMKEVKEFTEELWGKIESQLNSRFNEYKDFKRKTCT